MTKEIEYEVRMLEGNIARMCLTDDIVEFRKMYQWALKRVKEIKMQRLVQLEAVAMDCEKCNSPMLRRRYTDEWFCPDCDNISLL